jgi:hypothetical protein
MLEEGFGARSRNRTGMAGLGPRDFKSLVSTNFTIRAEEYMGLHFYIAECESAFRVMHYALDLREL